MDEPPRMVGAPSEYADAEEMPGCVIALVTGLFAIPFFLFRELPTLPLDGFIFVNEKFGRVGAILYVLIVPPLLIALVAGACWWLINWII